MADFQSAFDALEAEEVTVVAGSADPIEDAQKAVRELSIRYPLAYGLDAEAIAKRIGSYFDAYKEAKPVKHSKESEERITGGHAEVTKKFLQPTGILLRPDRTIEVVCYSSGHVGRLNAGEVLSLVRYFRKKE